MSSEAPPAPASPRSAEIKGTATLAAIGLWTITVPYIGELLGLTVDVAPIVEVVDHVVPGALVIAAALYLRSRARRGPMASDSTALLAAGVAFLAGFWVLATHVPLIGDANEGLVTWAAAIWHSIAAVPTLGLAVWCVVRSIPEP
jgi:hypothetical protein